MTDDLRPRLDEARATVEVGELPEVEGDARQLRRLLQNLVTNAVKFRAEAPPRIAVSAAAGSEGWIVTVRDNGRGVDAARHDADLRDVLARPPRHGGHGHRPGRGRRVVEAHGGRIWVEAGAGGGSAFRFTLPAA